jgi:NitT/TauT family transport system substrate-binding protein
MRRIAVFAVTVVLLAIAGCTSDDGKKEPVTTRVGLGVIPIVDVAPVYLGKSMGFFSKRGIDLDLVQEQGGPAIVKGVLAGTYEFGFSNVTSLMAAEAGGMPLKAVANGVASTGRPYRDFSAIVVPYGSPVRSAAELAGKKIAVNALKSLGDTTVRASVRKAGGDPSGIQFEAMPFASMPGVLQTGALDGAWIVEPQLSEAITLGAQVIASNFVDTAPDLTVAMYFTANGLLDRDPQLVAKFTAAVKESLAYAAGHPDEVRAAVGAYTTISDTVRISMALPNWPDEINRPSLERLAKLGQQDGIFARPPVLDNLLPAAGP